MSMKKANVTISMSWVFMIIVGTFFIVFAYNIIDKYQENEEKKFEASFKSSIRNILNNVGRTSGIEENSLEPLGNLFRDKSVEIKCQSNVPVLWIDEGSITDVNNQYLKNYPVFMTYIEQEKESSSYIAVESFRLPFKVTNMLALVSQKNLIILDNESEISVKLLEKFSQGSYSSLNIKFRDFDSYDITDFENEFRNSNLNSVIFVKDEQRPTYIDSSSLVQIDLPSYIVSIQEEANGKYGTITYLDSNSNIYSFDYIDYDKSLGLITMAIFSAPQTFECSYNQLFDSITSTYNFYSKKIDILISQIYGQDGIESDDDNWICSESVGSKTGQISYYQDLKDKLIDIKGTIISDRFNNKDQLYSKLVELQNLHSNLERFSCYYVY